MPTPAARRRVPGLLPVRARPSKRAVRARLAQQLAILKERYPERDTMLIYRDGFELLVATVLAAQCTDQRVNETTPALFQRFPTPAALGAADEDEVFELIRSISFPRSKAGYLVGLSRQLVADHAGEIPTTIPELIALPGVGRKTAQVVLTNIYAIPGFAVDTHCGRLARRLGWSHQHDPDKVEADLRELLPESSWIEVHQQLINHGRAVCTARAPRCGECPLMALCPTAPLLLPAQAAATPPGEGRRRGSGA